MVVMTEEDLPVEHFVRRRFGEHKAGNMNKFSNLIFPFPSPIGSGT